MSTIAYTDKAERLLNRIESGGEIRENIEAAAEVDDDLGALARVTLAVADRDVPDMADLEHAGVLDAVDVDAESE